MEEKIMVQMTEKALFDFMLFHTYSKFAGFLSNVLGMAVAFIGIILTVMHKATIPQLSLYLVAAVFFVGFTPIQLKMRAKKQMQANEEYKEENCYVFTEENLVRVYGEDEKVFSWDQIQKVVSTPKTIGFYYERDRALMIPKECFGKQFVPIIQMVMRHVDLSKINVR